MVTERPRDLSRRPREAAVRPFPRLETTPPVTKMCLATGTERTTAGPEGPVFWELPYRRGVLLPLSVDPAEPVEPAQRGRGVDGPRERPALRRRREHDEHAQDGKAAGDAQRQDRPGAQDRPEQVGPRVAEHAPLPEIGGE